MTKHAGGAVLVSCLIFITGCSSSSGSGGNGGGGGSSNGGGSNGGGGGTGTGGGAGMGGGSGTLSLDQLCMQAFSTECMYLVRCGAVSSQASCEQLIATHSNGPCDARTLGLIDAGTVKYDPAAAASCLSMFGSMACSGFAAAPAGPCEMIFVGQVAAGGQCVGGSECAPGSYCKSVSQCGGTCTAKIAVGQPVMEMDQCVDGASPVDGICVAATLHQGQSCDSPDGGFMQLPCVQPAYCSAINIDDGGFANICVAATAKQGQPCNNLDAGVRGCDGFMYCDNAGLCQPLIGPNAGCDNMNFSSQCMGDLWCDVGLAPAVCKPLSHTGEPCAFDGVCVDSNICDGGFQLNPDGGPWPLGACEPVPGAGQPCSGTCAPGLICDEFGGGTCVAPTKPDGQPCMSSAECLSGQCNFKEDAGMQLCGSGC